MPISRACSCGALLPEGKRKCEQCRPVENRPNATDRGYDYKWRKTRKQFLEANPWCVECGEPATDVDHIDGLGPLAPAGHDQSNLRGYCHSHHSARTARDQPPGSATRGSYHTNPFVILIGPSGVGKTTVRHHLEQLLTVDTFGPDDFDDRWTELFPHLDQSRHALVECVRIHSGLRRRIKEREATIVRVTAPTWVLRDRLDLRGENASTVQARIDETFQSGYGEDIPIDLELGTTNITAEQVAVKIAGFIAGRHGWELRTTSFPA